MYVLVYYVPVEELESTKKALFETGSGSMGEYFECCWQVKGEGQFLPGSLADPYTGEKEKLCKVPEYRVEMVLDDDLKEKAIEVLKRVHPYETPAYHLIKAYL